MSNIRQKFEYDGRTIYEWEQSLEEVLIFIEAPEGVTASVLDINITEHHLSVGIKGNPPFISEDTFDTVVKDESFWTMDGNQIEINLQKVKKASTWDSALKGHGGIDPLMKTEVQKKMTLERFQEEHPGFDFSGAEFNGAPPDPRTFLGGVPYK